MYTGVVCTLVECVECVHWWSVYTGGVCTLVECVECVECVHWWSVYTGAVCKCTLVELVCVECVSTTYSVLLFVVCVFCIHV